MSQYVKAAFELGSEQNESRDVKTAGINPAVVFMRLKPEQTQKLCLPDTVPERIHSVRTEVSDGGCSTCFHQLSDSVKSKGQSIGNLGSYVQLQYIGNELNVGQSGTKTCFCEDSCRCSVCCRCD